MAKAIKNEKLIPQSIDAEEALLGAILTNPKVYPRISDKIRVSDFYKPAHKMLYEAISALSERNSAVDIVTVSQWLSDNGNLDKIGGRNFVNELALNAITSVNIEHYAEIIKDKSIRRNLIDAGSQIVEMAYESHGTDTILDLAEKTIFNVASQKATQEIETVENLVMDAYNEIEYRYNHSNELSGLETGFTDLDAMTSGLQNSNLIILAARPSMGKTALALNIAQHAAIRKHLGVAVFSLEMSRMELMKRIISSEAEVDAGRMKSGRLHINDWEKITSILPVIQNAKLYIDDTSGLTISDMRSKCRRLKMVDKNLRLIVLDYLQLMQGTNPNDRNQEVSAISRGLKTLAKELDIPIIALSQLSRNNEKRNDKKPMLSDLRDSGAIEQDADIVMFIHREEYYKEGEEKIAAKGTAELIIAKNRSGSVGSVPLNFHSNITKFKNTTKQNIAYSMNE